MKTEIAFLPRSLAIAEGREEDATKRASYPQIHWRVTLRRDNGAEVWRGIYSQGIAHHPHYKHIKTATARGEIMESLETGKCRRPNAMYRMDKLVPPTEADVLQSLALDVDAMDYPSFEAWAGEFGYDTDSRRAEATYRDCLAIGLALRSLIGDEGIARLREEANA